MIFIGYSLQVLKGGIQKAKLEARSWNLEVRILKLEAESEKLCDVSFKFKAVRHGAFP
jgi:hypothetical protein